MRQRVDAGALMPMRASQCVNASMLMLGYVRLR